MSPLFREHWRRTRVAYLALLLLGVVTQALLDSTGGYMSLSPAGVSPWPAWIGASLAARLARPGAPSGEYWAALPVSRTRAWLEQIAFGLALLALSIALTAGAQLVARGFTSADAFATAHFPVADVAGLALLTFAATSYFAHSLESPAAARQAGLPGFFVALLFDVAWIGDDFTLRPWRAWALTAAFVALALACSASLAKRRAPAPGASVEGTLAAETFGARLLHALGQLAFVVCPLAGLIVELARSLAPQIATPLPLVGAGLFAVVALVALPRTLHARREAAGVRDRGVATLLGATGLGLSVWRALRPATAATACQRCGRVRAASAERCGACGSPRRTLVHAPWTQRRFASHLPWNLAAASALAFFGVGLLWQWLAPVAGTWSVRTTLPGVSLRLGTDPVEQRELHGSTFRGWNLAGAVRGTSGGFRRADLASTHAPAWTTAELRDALVSVDLDEKRLAAARLWVELALPFDASLYASSGGRAVRMSSLRLEGGSTNAFHHSTTWISVADDETAQRAARLASDLIRGRTSAAELARVAPDDEPYLTYFVRAIAQEISAATDARHGGDPHGRAALARDAALAFDLMLAPGEWSDARREVERARWALAELSFRAPLTEPENGVFSTRPYELGAVWAPLRTLALCAPDNLLTEEILDQNVFAAIAAGMRADPDLFDPCARLFRVHMRDDAKLFHDSGAAFTLTWVLFAIDVGRAEAVLAGEGFPSPANPAVRKFLWRELEEARRHPGSSSGAHARRDFSRRLANLDPGASAEDFWLGW